MIRSQQSITSLEHPGLEPYKTLRRPLEHLAKGIFVAEGEKVVTRLLESELTTFSLLLSQEWFASNKELIERNPNAIDLFVGEKKLLETIVGHHLHQSIMAIAKVPRPLGISEILRNLAESITKGKSRRLFLMVDGITNSENIGVIVRNCACFNVDALLVLPSSCDPYLRRSVRNSMGNIFKLPIVYLNSNTADRHHVSDLSADHHLEGDRADDRHHKGDGHLMEIKKLKDAGIRFYAAHPHPNSGDVRKIRLSENACIVLGAEGNGISQEILDLCDEFVSIPMKEGVDSLNVASASAVLLWEMMKND